MQLDIENLVPQSSTLRYVSAFLRSKRPVSHTAAASDPDLYLASLRRQDRSRTIGFISTHFPKVRIVLIAELGWLSKPVKLAHARVR